MIIKIKSVVTLDIPDELIGNMNGDEAQAMIDKYMISSYMEMLDENDKDFLEIGSREISEEMRDVFKERGEA